MSVYSLTSILKGILVLVLTFCYPPLCILLRKHTPLTDAESLYSVNSGFLNNILSKPLEFPGVKFFSKMKSGLR